MSIKTFCIEILLFSRERLVSDSGTVILSREFLAAENPELADGARIGLLPTPRAGPRDEKEETSGMALVSAIPIFDKGEVLGVIYGGRLLNRSTDMVDTVRDTVFQQETYKGRSIGTATSFLKISAYQLTFSPRRERGRLGRGSQRRLKSTCSARVRSGRPGLRGK